MHKSYQRWNPNNFFDPFPNFDDNVANDITDEWHSLNSAISIKLFTKCAISGDTLTMFIVECWFPIAIVFCEITNKSLIRFSLLLSGCPYDPEREDDQALPLDEGSFLLLIFFLRRISQILCCVLSSLSSRLVYACEKSPTSDTQGKKSASTFVRTFVMQIGTCW